MQPSADLEHRRFLPWLLAIGGAIGLLASFVLTVEKYALATDPAYSPSCSLNPVLNCGSVMDTPQAELFGFPNSLLGIAGFTVIAAVGAVQLAGAQFARWFWVALQVGVTLAVVFAHWLIFQSLYRIGALCPYCMVVWAVTIPIFWYVTLRSVRNAALSANHAVVLTVWVLVIAGLITHRFWDFWSGA